MYFRELPAVSIVLMSRRPGAPYVDNLSEDGTELLYEGHDARRSQGFDPKGIDQPWELPNGGPTENALFARSVDAFKKNRTAPASVRVYEKLRAGIWSDKGLFELIDYEYQLIDGRRVFRFKMRLIDEADIPHFHGPEEPSRAIPSWVKQAVFKRDKGKCVLCGLTDHLHFDHELPFSRGGTSVLPENVRLLCARHNLQKAGRIE